MDLWVFICKIGMLGYFAYVFSLLKIERSFLFFSWSIKHSSTHKPPYVKDIKACFNA